MNLSPYRLYRSVYSISILICMCLFLTMLAIPTSAQSPTPTPTPTVKIYLVSTPLLQIASYDREVKYVKVVVKKGEVLVPKAVVEITPDAKLPITIVNPGSNKTVTTDDNGEATVQLQNPGKVAEGAVTLTVTHINKVVEPSPPNVVLRVQLLKPSPTVDISAAITSLISFLLIMILLSIGVEKVTEAIKIFAVEIGTTFSVKPLMRPEPTILELTGTGATGALDRSSFDDDRTTNLYALLRQEISSSLDDKEQKNLKNFLFLCLIVVIVLIVVLFAKGPLVLGCLALLLTVVCTAGTLVTLIRDQNLHQHIDKFKTSATAAKGILETAKTSVDQLNNPQLTVELEQAKASVENIIAQSNAISPQPLSNIAHDDSTRAELLTLIQREDDLRQKKQAQWTGMWRIISLLVSIAAVVGWGQTGNSFTLLKPFFDAMNIETPSANLLGGTLTAFGAAAGSQFWHDTLDRILALKEKVKP